MVAKPSVSVIHHKIKLLIENLINIRDDAGEFLVPLKDGRKIQAKCWNGWEWTQGVGLYGIWKFYEITGDAQYLKIIEDWFAERFAEGSTDKSINTMAPFLTLAFLYEKTGNITYLPWLDAWAEWAMYIAQDKVWRIPAYHLCRR